MQVRRSTSRGRVGIVALVVAALAAFAPAAPAQAHQDGKHGGKQDGNRELTVMTQNLYLGSDLTPAIVAPDGASFLKAVATIYGTVQFTNFPQRAVAIASIIATERPDLVGLQEVAKWTSTGPGAPPSQDFLDILAQALAAKGLHYAVAAVSDNATIGPVPLLLCASTTIGACMLTFHDRDVILVNTTTPGLKVFNPHSGRYVTQAVVPTTGGPQSFDRGWASVDGKYRGERFHFVNTHLETEDFPAVQEAQAAEFLAGPAKSTGTVIATGDFNSAADGSTTKSYAMLTKSYFTDAWATNPGDPGLSCCHDGALADPTKPFGSRIDLVLTHHDVRPLSAHLIGLAAFQATPPLWASDHAGVVATLRLQ